MSHVISQEAEPPSLLHLCVPHPQSGFAASISCSNSPRAYTVDGRVQGVDRGEQQLCAHAGHCSAAMCGKGKLAQH